MENEERLSGLVATLEGELTQYPQKSCGATISLQYQYSIEHEKLATLPTNLRISTIFIGKNLQWVQNRSCTPQNP